MPGFYRIPQDRYNRLKPWIFYERRLDAQMHIVGGARSRPGDPRLSAGIGARDGPALVVFTLRAPGRLVDSTREIVSHMIAAKTPVAVFVGPSGARAASA